MQTFLRKYGVQTTIHFVLYEVDGVDLRVDAVDAGADCSIMKDEGAEVTCTNDFADEGTGYSLVITATEMEFAEGMIYIVDSAAKVWLDEALKIETYGHASAMHAEDFSITKAAALATYDSPTKAEMDTAHGLLSTEAKQDIMDTNVDTLLTRITAAVALASVCTEARLGELGATNIPADIDTLLTRLSAARAGYLDNLSAGAVALASALTTHDGKLDTLDTVADGIQTDLSNATDGLGALKALIDAVKTVADAVQAKTDNLPADPADDSDIDAQLAAIAGYLDTEIAAIITHLTDIKGAGWTDENITTMDALIDAIKAITDALPNSGALTIDGVGFDAALTQILAYVSGNIAKSGDAYTYKKRNGSTTAFTNTAAAAARTRS